MRASTNGDLLQGKEKYPFLYFRRPQPLSRARQSLTACLDAVLLGEKSGRRLRRGKLHFRHASRFQQMLFGLG